MWLHTAHISTELSDHTSFPGPRRGPGVRLYQTIPRSQARGGGLGARLYQTIPSLEPLAAGGSGPQHVHSSVDSWIYSEREGGGD